MLALQETFEKLLPPTQFVIVHFSTMTTKRRLTAAAKDKGKESCLVAHR